MKRTKRSGLRGLVLMMSILVIGAAALPAETDEPGPFERLFRALRHASSQPRHTSTTHRTSHKEQTADTTTSSNETSTASASSTSNNKPPSEKNTRSTSRASAKKGADLPYGTPVPGKQGFVTSPFAPNSGYIDARGFAPGTPVKDPYTGKVFLTP